MNKKLKRKLEVMWYYISWPYNYIKLETRLRTKKGD